METSARTRASWLAMVGLGMAIALLVAVGDGGGSGVADAAGTNAAASDIRSVDFGEVPPPGSACSEGLRFTPPATIPVAAGRSPVLDIARFTRLEVDPDVTYGDLDGDGADEAAVHVVCSYGANGAEDTVHVWRLQDGRPQHVAGVGEPPASVTGPLPSAVEGVRVVGGRVEVTWTRYADDDPHCCPSGSATVAYELDGDRLARVGSPVDGRA